MRKTACGAIRHIATTGWGPQALNNSSIHPRHPARTASLCPFASLSIPFFSIQRLESKGERDTLFRCCPLMRWRSDRKTSMPWRKVCFSKRVSLYCSCLVCFFTTFFFTPFAFLVFFRRPQGSSRSLGSGQHTLRLLARRTRLLTFPEPSC